MDAYRRAGVDLDAAARAVDLIRDVAAAASRPEVVSSVGGFAGLFRLRDDLLLAAATDGVGTKVEVARKAGRVDTVGIDLVAMCANDVVCTGAEPLFFLDYVVAERVVPDEVAAVVAGVAEGCRRAGCALLGGETAEHPGHLGPGTFDLAGFCVGVVSERDLLGPHRVREGDVLIGLASSGLHSNGYSLVRKAVEEASVDLGDVPPGLGRPLAEELLEPTAIYVRGVLDAARAGLIEAAAHITGGGLVENVPRALPPGLGAEVDTSRWRVPEVFPFIAGLIGASPHELHRTFNMGLGMVVVARADRAEPAVEALRKSGVPATTVGVVRPGDGLRLL